MNLNIAQAISHTPNGHRVRVVPLRLASIMVYARIETHDSLKHTERSRTKCTTQGYIKEGPNPILLFLKLNTETSKLRLVKSIICAQ